MGDANSSTSSSLMKNTLQFVSAVVAVSVLLPIRASGGGSEDEASKRRRFPTLYCQETTDNDILRSLLSKILLRRIVPPYMTNTRGLRNKQRASLMSDQHVHGVSWRIPTARRMDNSSSTSSNTPNSYLERLIQEGKIPILLVIVSKDGGISSKELNHVISMASADEQYGWLVALADNSNKQEDHGKSSAGVASAESSLRSALWNKMTPRQRSDPSLRPTIFLLSTDWIPPVKIRDIVDAAVSFTSRKSVIRRAKSHALPMSRSERTGPESDSNAMNQQQVRQPYCLVLWSTHTTLLEDEEEELTSPPASLLQLCHQIPNFMIVSESEATEAWKARCAVSFMAAVNAVKTGRLITGGEVSSHASPSKTMTSTTSNDRSKL